MEKITKREILEYLETIQGEITDIQHRSDSIGDSENRCSSDTLEELVNELRFNIEYQGIKEAQSDLQEIQPIGVG
tara:strand:- start:242 stop:466 length:225 start_codon:yes stop_codon:yes gene_type:complete